MREPPLGLEKIPHPALAVFFERDPVHSLDRGTRARLYEKGAAAASEASALLAQTIPMADAPSIRFAHRPHDVRGHLPVWRTGRQSPGHSEQRRKSAQWLRFLKSVWP